MIDAGENRVSRGIERGRIVIYLFKTIFTYKNRATGEVKSKLLAKRVLRTVLSKRVLINVLRISGGRGKVLNALERVAGYHAKSRKPVVSKRKNIDRIEKRRAHVQRTDIRPEIRFVLVSAVNAGIEGKPTREVMREGQSDVSGSLVLARHIEILGKAAHPDQTNLCALRGTSISENNVFSREHRALAGRAN